MDKKHRIYAQRAGQRAGLPVPPASITLMRTLEAHQAKKEGPVLPKKSSAEEFGPLAAAAVGSHAGRTSLSELHFKLVERLAPPSVLVDKEYNIVHLSEHAGKYLQLSGGEPRLNLLRLIRPELRTDLHGALFQAAETSSMVTVQSVPVMIDGVSHAVDLRVSPAGDLAPGHMLVILEARQASDSDDLQPPRRGGPESVINRLERESEALKSRLRDTVEQYEASCEELKAGNEELQAMNEELRCASEELETSREEL
ncbi:MAG: hypothetical protein B7Z52_06195 [Burkholderiales bacterium 12-64-5]|nr:MAG: hypothetical protein B7Z52_06195 [Burkholderiales bacterium 12-64-5]